MIKPSALIATGALAAFAATALAQGGPTVEVRATMQQQVNPAMLAVWDVSNNAMDDGGGLDPAQLDDAKWAQIAEQATKLAAAGEQMAAATNLIIAFPENRAVAEGEMTMELVQQHLSADPEGFRKMAREMAAHADKLASAAKAKDAAAAGRLIGEMDAVCETCHSHFWYPE